MRGATGNEAPTNLFGCAELAAGKGSSSRNRISWAIIFWSLGFEQAQDAIGAIRRPRRDRATIGLAQGLGRSHTAPSHKTGGAARVTWPTRLSSVAIADAAHELPRVLADRLHPAQPFGGDVEAQVRHRRLLARVG